VTNDASTGGKAHEIVSTLGIAGGTKTDGTKGAMAHVIGMFFVSLNVGTEREANVFVIREFTTGEEETRGVIRGDSVGMWESVEPEDRVSNEAGNNQPGKVAERKEGVSASGSVLDGADHAFDIGDVFIGAAGIERGKKRAEGFELRVGEDAGDLESAMLI
jgi:hypothetical protein